MAKVVGPILGFRGKRDNNWAVCALWVSEGEDSAAVEWSAAGTAWNDAEARALKTLGKRTIWCADWEVGLTDREQDINYRLRGGTAEWVFTVPARMGDPRFAYASCNGFSSPAAMRGVDDKNAMWLDLSQHHEGAQDEHHEQEEEAKFHLLLMGGDQLYADSIWEVVPSLKRWSERSGKRRWDARFTAEMQRQVERFYFDLYCERWAQAEPAAVFARIPTVMMWDDHDIFDGWGSYPEHRQNSPVYNGIFKIAREHFSLFQLRADPSGQPAGMLGGGYNSVHNLGKVAIAVLDLRSERSPQQVMSQASWNAVTNALEGINSGGSDCKHLLVMSSIPVVYLDLAALETSFSWIPGQQELEDDLLDHWRAGPHRAERLRLIHRLLRFAEKKKCRVTILSGDVHVGALGVLESTRGGASGSNATVINQLISSAIVHPGPPRLILYVYGKLAEKVEAVDRGITARMIEFPATDRAFIGTRNWLSLKMDSDHRVWAEWRAEKEDQPYTKVIHPVDA